MKGGNVRESASAAELNSASAITRPRNLPFEHVNTEGWHGKTSLAEHFRGKTGEHSELGLIKIHGSEETLLRSTGREG